jgi:hypothetical protein
MYNSCDMWEKVVCYTTSDPSLTGCVAEVRVQSDVSGEYSHTLDSKGA